MATLWPEILNLMILRLPFHNIIPIINGNLKMIRDTRDKLEKFLQHLPLMCPPLVKKMGYLTANNNTNTLIMFKHQVLCITEI